MAPGAGSILWRLKSSVTHVPLIKESKILLEWNGYARTMACKIKQSNLYRLNQLQISLKRNSWDLKTSAGAFHFQNWNEF